jgi:7-cyano-7-deazaguanine synthase
MIVAIGAAFATALGRLAGGGTATYNAGNLDRPGTTRGPASVLHQSANGLNTAFPPMAHTLTERESDVAVLASGGIDSAILCIDLLDSFARVHPLYVRFGLRWEEIELAGLRAFLDASRRPGLEVVSVLDEPIADVYGAGHWSTTGAEVPGSETSDDAVYLPGRNLLLAAKASVWCRLRGIESLAFGCLAANPFPDSSAPFFSALESVVNHALGGRLRLIRPFERLHKEEVLRRGAGLPLHATFSCLRPVHGRHCGSCNKCAERRRGFHRAGWTDPTDYARDGRAEEASCTG